jgi:hypothetical protein
MRLRKHQQRKYRGHTRHCSFKKSPDATEELFKKLKEKRSKKEHRNLSHTLASEVKEQE